MKSEVAYKLWKIKILLGRYPAKIDEYRISKLRKSIIELFDCISTVVYDGITIDEVKSAFISRVDIVDKVCDILMKNRYLKNGKKGRKIIIIFSKNQMLKWDMVEDENRLKIKIPMQEF